MADYRDPAGSAPDEPPPPSVATIGKIEHTIEPFSFGRWTCPCCGAWRMGSAGTAVPLTQEKKSAGAVLRRDCSRCEYVWYVAPVGGFP